MSLAEIGSIMSRSGKKLAVRLIEEGSPEPSSLTDIIVGDIEKAGDTALE